MYINRKINLKVVYLIITPHDCETFIYNDNNKYCHHYSKIKCVVRTEGVNNDNK